MALSVLKTIRF